MLRGLITGKDSEEEREWLLEPETVRVEVWEVAPEVVRELELTIGDDEPEGETNKEAEPLNEAETVTLGDDFLGESDKEAEPLEEVETETVTLRDEEGLKGVSNTCSDSIRLSGDQSSFL